MRIILNGRDVDAHVVITTYEPVPEAEEQQLLLKGIKIAYDCGHGGMDPGAIGASGAYEKDYNRRIGDAIMMKLRENGAEVIDVRPGDAYIELSERCRIVNEVESDIFISGHHNGSDNPEARGIEIYHFAGSVKGKALAEAIHRQIAPASGLKDRGVKEANFQVLRDTNMPAVLIEFGFITNVEDEKRTTSNLFIQNTANKIVENVIEYYPV